MAKSKTHPEPVETLADAVEVDDFFGGGHHLLICSENDEAVSRPSLAQDEKYSRALSHGAEMRVRVETSPTSGGGFRAWYLWRTSEG